MSIPLFVSFFVHVIVLLVMVFLPDTLFNKPPEVIAENRVILDVALVVDRGKVAEKQQLKQPKKLVNQQKTPAPQPKKVEVKKPPPKKQNTAKKVEKKAPVKPQAVQKVAPKKSPKPETKPIPQNTVKVEKKDVLNTKKLLETKDKTTPQISDKKAEKSTQLYKEKAQPKKIINDVKQTGSKSQIEQNLVDTVDPNQLMAQLMNKVTECWDIPAGVPNAKNLIVTVYVRYAPDGTVASSKVSKTSFSENTPGMQQMIDAAQRAVNRPDCNPIGLDADSYDSWKEVFIEFDPKSVLQ